MAKRPIFIPNEKGFPMVREEMIEFVWFSGFSVQQKQRSIASLHESAELSLGVTPILEISSKADSAAGRELSAFNLLIDDPGLGQATSVEAAFQGSKVFEDGGPHIDLYKRSAREARRDPRLKESGELIGFEFDGRRWELEPRTAFYEWIYLHALQEHPELAKHLPDYRGFTDIEFNPKRSINCQARAAALYVALASRELLTAAIETPERYLQLISMEE